MITCDEIINTTKTIPTNFNEKLYILLALLLITIALLIAVSIYCYLMQYRAKQKTFIIMSRHK